MNIGFDLDKIFINFPPLVPTRIIDWFYKGKPDGSLKYRIPGRAEQLLRLLMHYPLLRRPIKENIEFMKKLAAENAHIYYLISSRFGFLKKTTEKLVHKYGLDKMFKSLHFNFSNSQPHIFKNEIIKKLNVDLYVDDDLQLLEYLVNKNPKTNFFWLNNKISKPMGKNLFAIKNISEMFTPHQSGAGFK